MIESENIGNFFKAGKQIAKEWMDVKLDALRKKMIRSFAKAAGHLMWVMISYFLATLFILFAGITAGFWLSKLTGSYAKGFGIVTLAIALVIIFLALFRTSIFVLPITRSMLKKTSLKSVPEI
jgi:hypothetical protein